MEAKERSGIVEMVVNDVRADVGKAFNVGTVSHMERAVVTLAESAELRSSVRTVRQEVSVTLLSQMFSYVVLSTLIRH